MPVTTAAPSEDERHCKRQKTTAKCRAQSAKCEWVTRKGCMTHAAAVLAKMETRPPHFAAATTAAPGDAALAEACKKYRSIQGCDTAAEGCHWERGLKCLPGRRGQPQQAQGAPQRSDRPATAPAAPEVAVNGGPAHIESCKAHKTISACNTSSDVFGRRCIWKPRLKCIPDVRPVGPIPPRGEQQRDTMVRNLEEKCLSMTNAITLEDYADKDLKFLRGIVQIGNAYGEEQKRHCFHYSVLYNWWCGEVIKGRALTNPITREAVTDADIVAVLKAKAAAERTAITASRPAVFVHFVATENTRYFVDGAVSRKYYFLEIVIWTCKLSSFKRSRDVRLVQIGTLPAFEAAPTSPNRATYNSKAMLATIKHLFESTMAFMYPKMPYRSDRVGERMPVIPAIACLNRPSSEWFNVDGTFQNGRLLECFNLLKPYMQPWHMLQPSDT